MSVVCLFLFLASIVLLFRSVLNHLLTFCFVESTQRTRTRTQLMQCSLLWRRKSAYVFPQNGTRSRQTDAVSAFRFCVRCYGPAENSSEIVQTCSSPSCRTHFAGSSLRSVFCVASLTHNDMGTLNPLSLAHSSMSRPPCLSKTLPTLFLRFLPLSLPVTGMLLLPKLHQSVTHHYCICCAQKTS